MARLALLAAAVVTGALATGCGDAGPTLSTPAPATQAPTTERADGRLGGATALRPGAPLRRLSDGGRPDLREPDAAPRRDGVGAGAGCPGPDLAPAAGTLPAMADATLCLLNGERADHGLAALAANAQLAAAAGAYAQDLVAGSYFSHTGRDGSGLRERVARTGYLAGGRQWRLGENLAWGTGVLAAPGAIVRAWMNSPGHRANILDPAFREIGIGIVPGNPARADGAGATYATEFGLLEAPAAAPAAARTAAPKRAKPRRRKARTTRRDRGRRGARARIAA